MLFSFRDVISIEKFNCPIPLHVFYILDSGSDEGGGIDILEVASTVVFGGLLLFGVVFLIFCLIDR